MKQVDDSLGCGWNDEAMALALTLEAHAAIPTAVTDHASTCMACAEELKSFRGLEDRVGNALAGTRVPGDLSAAQEAVRVHRSGEEKGVRWWAPGFAFACAIALLWGLVLDPSGPPAVAGSGDVVSVQPLLGGPLAGLTEAERIEVESVLAQVAEGEVEAMGGSLESFPDETYWDVAEDIEGQDLDGLEEALDALLEG